MLENRCTDKNVVFFVCVCLKRITCNGIKFKKYGLNTHHEDIISLVWRHPSSIEYFFLEYE